MVAGRFDDAALSSPDTPAVCAGVKPATVEPGYQLGQAAGLSRMLWALAPTSLTAPAR
ncbi:MAG: hypothetical protein WDO24_23315 [Pseudomonadota bacterium]